MRGYLVVHELDEEGVGVCAEGVDVGGEEGEDCGVVLVHFVQVRVVVRVQEEEGLLQHLGWLLDREDLGAQVLLPLDDASSRSGVVSTFRPR